MGQCSTLPAGNNNVGENDGYSEYDPIGRRSNRQHQHQHHHQHQRQTRDDNSNTFQRRQGAGPTSLSGSENSAFPRRNSERGNSENMNRLLQVNTNMNNTNHMEEDTGAKSSNPASHGMKSSRKNSNNSLVAMETREEPPICQPPEGSLRTRCYRLNLEQPISLMTSSSPSEYFGPLNYDPPTHHLPRRVNNNRRRVHSWNVPQDAMMTLQVSGSEDGSAVSVNKSPTEVAISTARIFRGISVDKHGTILSQNARASRSNRNKGGNSTKVGEKSRQASKIDKAKDLVDDCLTNAGKENEGEKMNLVSLVIMGDYTDMKHLVKDGAKKLREAEGLPDEALLSFNRPHPGSIVNCPFAASRAVDGFSSMNSNQASPNSPSRKRLNMHYQVSTPSRSRNRLQNNSGNYANVPNSAPPKLKGHPRDKVGLRRTSTTGNPNDYAETRNSSGRFQPNNCHDMFPLGRGDSDWGGLSKGFHSFWNCGANSTNNIGTMSPTNHLNNNHEFNVSSVRTEIPVDRRHESATRYDVRGGMEGREAPGEVLMV